MLRHAHLRGGGDQDMTFRAANIAEALSQRRIVVLASRTVRRAWSGLACPELCRRV